MAKQFYNKLIRDKIPEVIAGNGDQYEIRELASGEFKTELLKKLAEEANEVIAASSPEELIKELADVQDVINEIKKLESISDKQITEAQRAAFNKKGGFVKRLFLVWTDNR